MSTLPPQNPSNSLTMKTAKGTGWIVAWRVTTRLLGMVNTLVLMKVLAPSDFGLVALATLFAQAIDGLAEIGVSEALVREKSLDRAMYDTGFTLNVMRGLLTASLLLAGAYPLAAFFGDERLVNIMLVLAVAMLLSASENIGIVDFQRDFTFGREFSLFVFPRIAGIAVAITTAWWWHSYWALVVAIFTTRCLRAGLSYVMHPYRPRLTLRAWRRMLAFSSWSWVLSITVLIRDRVDAFVIGRLLGSAPLGIYTVAWEVGFAPTAELVGPFCRALFPGFSLLRSRDGDVADAYFRAIAAAMLVIMPAGFGIALIADPFVRAVLGNRWLEAIPLLQIFAVVGAVRASAIISGTLLRVYGLQRVQVSVYSISILVRVVLAVILVSQFGLIGGAYAATASIFVEEVGLLVTTFRRFRLRVVDLLSSNWRCALAAAVMTVAVLVCRDWRSTLPGLAGVGIAGLAIDVLVGALSYSVALIAIWLASGKPRGAETYIMDIVRQTMKRQRARQGVVQ